MEDFGEFEFNFYIIILNDSNVMRNVVLTRKHIFLYMKFELKHDMNIPRKQAWMLKGNK